MLRISGKVRILDNKSLELAQHQSRAPACAIRENGIGNLREKAGKQSALEKYRHAFNVVIVRYLVFKHQDETSEK